MATKKGKTFEKEVSTLLSLNWSDGKRDDIFYSTSGSGSRATLRFRRGKKTEGQFGDIGYTDAIGKPLIDYFNFELKTGYATKSKTKKGVLTKTNWCLTDCIDTLHKKNPVQFKEFWCESIVDATKSGREPVLVFRRNNKRPVIVLYTQTFHKMIDLFPIPKFSYITISDNEGDYTAMNLQSFLNWADLKLFINTMTEK